MSKLKAYEIWELNQRGRDSRDCVIYKHLNQQFICCNNLNACKTCEILYRARNWHIMRSSK